MIRYIQTLNKAYFKNLPHQTNENVTKLNFASVPTLPTFYRMVSYKQTVLERMHEVGSCSTHMTPRNMAYDV